MGHLTTRDAYRSLGERINWFTQGAPESETLSNLIFDNQAFANHRALAAALGAILELPPIKQALASKQLKSVYLDKLLSMQVNWKRKDNLQKEKTTG